MKFHQGKVLQLNLSGIKTVSIEELLGSGGFADVWKVKDLATGKLYALKHIRHGDPEGRLILMARNEAGVRIPSDKVASYYGLVELSKKDLGVLLEYIPGQRFDDWIRDNQSLSWEHKKRILVEILEGVADIHQCNIVHRDLSASNIMITDENRVKIIDFLVAKFPDSEVFGEGEWAGTLTYMDPYGLLYGMAALDTRADIFAVGVLLHQLVRGDDLWATTGMEFADFVHEVTSGKKSFMELDTGFSFDDDDTVRDVIHCSTMFDREERTRTIQEMISQLSGAPSSEQEPEEETPISLASGLVQTDQERILYQITELEKRLLDRIEQLQQYYQTLEEKISSFERRQFIDVLAGEETRLKRRIYIFEQQWNLLSDKLSRLEKERIMETRAEEIFRLEKLIDDVRDERRQVDQRLKELERR